MSVVSRRTRLARVAPQKRNGGTLSEPNKRLQMLQRVTSAVYSTLDSEEVFKQITDRAVFSLGYTLALVAVLNGKKQCFEIKALSAKKEVLPQMEKLSGFSLSSLSIPADPEINATTRALAEGRAVAVKTLAEIAYPILGKEVCSALQKLGGSKNCIVMPLQAKGGIAGALYVSSPREEASQEELTMLQNFAWVASQAIRNANLYRRTKQAQEALQGSMIRYEELAESIDDAFFAFDGELRYIYWNRASEELTGISAKDALGKHLYDIFPRDEQTKRAERGYLEALKKKQPKHFLNEYQLGDKHFLFEISAYPTKDGLSVFARDITERKQAEELYSTLANSSPVGIYIAVDNRYVFVNQILQKTTGYSEEELLGMDPLSLIHSEDRESARQKAVRMLKGQSFQPYEFRFFTKNGETRWAMERVASITYQGRRATLGVSINITEYKQAEQLYYTLADSSPVGVYIVQDGKFVFTNPVFRRSMGYTEKELLGTDSSSLIHPEDRESVRENAVEMLKGERLQGYEFRFITKSGETKWALERVTSIIYEGKRATLANFMDITGRKETQQRIERAAEEWRTTFDSITDFVSIHDKDNRIARVNKALANALKTKPQELIGKVCHEVMHGTKEPPANCPQRQTLRTGKPATIEMFEPNLGIHFQESSSPIFDAKGEVIGSVHIVRDVSERKRMEQQLVMTDRLASIGELASGIAHELNNPLTSVIGFSQLLMEGDVPDNIKEDLGTVYSEAQRAAAIVKNLLTFARKHAPVKQLSQVNTILDDVLRLRAYEERVNNIEVDKRLGTNLPEIMVDQFQIQQVFLNIIVNAEFAMLEAHGKGKLTITTERVSGIIKVTFADDGPGITEENLKRLFQPFFTTKEVGKGTGLGLSICHGIVSGHGGRIYAESEFGQGATFVVELPTDGH